MLFDNFDKKIKEAAEQHHPAYDENAWRKMESLLNEHLPQEKDRRRIILLAFSVLLIGGGAFFFLSKPHAKNVQQTVQDVKSSTGGNRQEDKPDKNTLLVQPATGSTNTEITTDNTLPDEITKNAEKATKVPGVISQNNIVTPQSKQKIGNNNAVVLGNASIEMDKNIGVSQSERKNDQIKQEISQQQSDNRMVKNESPVSIPVTKKDELASNTQQPEVLAKKGADKNGKPKIKNGFSFFVSAGPDISKAQNSKAGKVTMAWGLGVGYTLNRITLRSGVFSANKIYWASPADYKLTYSPPQNWKFMGADANCRVIEIPVKLSYNFAARNKSNWFAGAGLSSYLMKRENYVYEYKSTTTGSSYYHPYETKNENKHYFSVLDLSGGYSYQLSNTVSLSAEPYLEVPLTGIGAGKVHLNSGGVLFSVGVHPFRK